MTAANTRRAVPCRLVFGVVFRYCLRMNRAWKAAVWVLVGMVGWMACQGPNRPLTEVEKALQAWHDVNATKTANEKELIDIRNQLLSMPADSPPTRELTRRLAILNKKAQELAFEEFRASRVYEAAVEDEAEAKRQAALGANATANAQTNSSARPIHEVAGIQLFPFSIATDTNNGIRALSGTVTNTRTNAIDELTLEFDVFDSGDQMLGATSDFIATLPGGSNWNFKAILLDTNIVRVVFKEFRDASGTIQPSTPSTLPSLPGNTPAPEPTPAP